MTTATGTGARRQRPAAVAAARGWRASFVLGGLGLTSAIFVLAGPFGSWRVTARAAARPISIFGQTLSYPTANLDAVIVVLLAALGSVVTALALSGAVRELRASIRFHRHLASLDPQPRHGALLIADEQPRAFCAGLLRPRVYLSTGAVAILDQAALNAVVAHERHHARRHDPLRLAAGRVLVRALFFLPEIGDLVACQQVLAELSADESAVDAAPANRSALARAMLSFSDAPAAVGSTGIDPARVDYLLGDPPSWRFPALVCLAAASVIALLAAIALLAGRLASGSATLALPFLSQQPCILVLAAIPAVLASLAAMYRSRRRALGPPRAVAGRRRARNATLLGSIVVCALVVGVASGASRPVAYCQLPPGPAQPSWGFQVGGPIRTAMGTYAHGRGTLSANAARGKLCQVDRVENPADRQIILSVVRGAFK